MTNIKVTQAPTQQAHRFLVVKRQLLPERQHIRLQIICQTFSDENALRLHRKLEDNAVQLKHQITGRKNDYAYEAGRA